MLAPQHDPGGKSLFALQPGVHGTAYITPDEKDRLWLGRVWGTGARYALIVGMNPSVARPDMDDPTIRRDIGFAQRWGFDGVFKTNVSTYRATNPKMLLAADVRLAHPDNLFVARKMAGRCSKVVLAYGAIHPKLESLAKEYVAALRAICPELWCFGRTKAGHPKHTLYLPNDAALELF